MRLLNGPSSRECFKQNTTVSYTEYNRRFEILRLRCQIFIIYVTILSTLPWNVHVNSLSSNDPRRNKCVLKECRFRYFKRSTLQSAIAPDSQADARVSSSLHSGNKENSCSKTLIPLNQTCRVNDSKKNNQTKARKKQQLNKFRIRDQFIRAKELERKGQWRKASNVLRSILDIDPTDSYSYLALAKLEAKRARSSQDADHASQIFANGVKACPSSIHLWQAWAVYEESRGNITNAKNLFEEAIKLDPFNPYVCHAYGLMLRRLEIERRGSSYSIEARRLWEQALEKTSTAALVCSLGEMLTTNNEFEKSRELYERHITKLETEKDKTEVYLAMAWLEERYFSNFELAEQLLNKSLKLSPTSSIAQIAIARLKGRRQQRIENLNNSKSTSSSDKFISKGERVHTTIARSLANACLHIESERSDLPYGDGRVHNAWANLEVKADRLINARKILSRGLRRYPNDHSLLQAAGKIEERLGNHTGARAFYRSSLQVQPSAPALVAYALLELKSPQKSYSGSFDFEYISQLFEEALMIDPRHGPGYNAYARFVFEQQGDDDKARTIFERGVRANCTDVASIYHGFAKVELSVGNVDRARQLLLEGQEIVRRLDGMMDSPHRERSLFLTHTLGMLELKSNRPLDALNVFTDGINRYGNSSQLLLGSALCQTKLGRAQTAREFFERSVMNDEKHAQAWEAWGVMEARSGNFATAKKIFDCGLAIVPKYGALWQAYGTMQARLGNIDHARSLFEKGIRMAPRYVQLYQSWASMELREENFVAARALIAKALTLDKRNGYGWVVSAEIEDLTGNTGLGILMLRRGIECCPNSAKLYHALGDILVRQKKINEAREVMEEGLEVDPLYAPLYHSLAELEARVFNIAGLAKLNKRAAAIFNANKLETPSTLSDKMWGSSIKARRSRSHQRTKTTALGPRIVDEDGSEQSVIYSDIDNFLDEVLASSSNLLEDSIVDELFSDKGDKV